jgi:WD40 repeat protein
MFVRRRCLEMVSVLLLALCGAAASGQSAGVAYVDSDQVLSVAYSPDGRFVAGGGWGKAIKLWDARSGKVARHLEAKGKSGYRSIAFSPDGQTIAGCGDDGLVRFWNVRTGSLERTIPVSTKSTWLVLSIAFSPDGKKLAAATRFRMDENEQVSEVCVLDVASGMSLWTWQAPGNNCIYSVGFSPDAKSIIAADGQVRLLNAETGVLDQSLAVEKYFTMRVAFSPDGKYLAGAGGHEDKLSDGHLTLWSAKNYAIAHSRTQLERRLMCMAFSPDGKYLATGSGSPLRFEGNRQWMSSEVQLWDPASAQLLRRIPGQLGETSDVAFSPDGKSLLSCDDEGVMLSETITGLFRLQLMKTTILPRSEK